MRPKSSFGYGSTIEISTIIGKKIKKISGRPFKSQYRTNTVKAITINPNTSREAFTFEEDNSIVDAHQCILLEE